MKTKTKPYAQLSKKYKKGVVFDGKERIDAVIKVLNRDDTVIYLIQDEEMSDGSNTITLKFHYQS